MFKLNCMVSETNIAFDTVKRKRFQKNRKWFETIKTNEFWYNNIMQYVLLAGNNSITCILFRFDSSCIQINIKLVIKNVSYCYN